MALQSTGAIKFSEIKTEFGDSNGSAAGVSLGNYRVKETYGEMSNMPLDEGIPQSGTIKMSDFHGKRLNVVVNYYSGGTENRPNTGSQRYKNNGQSECVGEFKDPPAGTSGSKVWLHVNKTIGSEGASQASEAPCAFRTGNWQNDTDLRVLVGNEGKIYGRGGDGGNGGRGRTGGGETGSHGTSAIGIQYSNGTTIVTSNPQAVAAGGGGGGGGGGAARQEDRGKDRSAGGGGGGGGAGLPAGSGGPGGTGGGRYSRGFAGDNGGLTGGGTGGVGGRNAGEAIGGDGGNGGSLGEAGQSGETGNGDDGVGGGGAGGRSGEWIRTAGNSVQTSGWQGTAQGTASSGNVE